MRLYDRHAATPKGLIEVGRTMRSKTFDMGGRKRKTVQTIGPLHWHDGTQLQDIDLQPVEQADGMLRVDRCAYKLIVDPATAWLRHESRETGLRARVGLLEIGGQPVTLPTPTVEDGRILWPEVVPDVDIELVIKPNGAEWFKIVKSPSAPHDFTWTVERQEGFDPARIKMATAGVDAGRNRLRMTHRQTPARTEAGWVKLTQTETFARQVSRVVDRKTRRRAWAGDPEYPVRIDQDITENIVAGSDDVGSFFTTGFYSFPVSDAAIGIGSSGLPFNAGLRFQTIAVPAGATIDLAVLKTYQNDLVNSPNIAIFGEDADDPPAFSASDRMVDMTPTTASATFQTGTNGTYVSHTVTSIVAEIVARGGWASGNDMRFGLLNQGTGYSSNFLSFEAYEAAGTNHALLEIDYTEAATGGLQRSGMALMGVGV